jgi:hypothetical protein
MLLLVAILWPSLWSSGQSSLLQVQRSRVRFPALPNFLEVVGLERGPLSGFGSRKLILTAVGIRCADHATPSIRKVDTNFAYKRRSLNFFLTLTSSIFCDKRKKLALTLRKKNILLHILIPDLKIFIHMSYSLISYYFCYYYYYYWHSFTFFLMCTFLSSRARFVIDLWTVKLALK